MSSLFTLWLYFSPLELYIGSIEIDVLSLEECLTDGLWAVPRPRGKSWILVGDVRHAILAPKAPIMALLH